MRMNQKVLGLEIRQKLIRTAVFVLLLSVNTAFTPHKEQDTISLLDKPTVFYLERNRDANQILYKVNVVEDGTLDQDSPINGYWIKYTHNGEIEPITWIQNQFAFGFKYTAVSETEATFHFAPYDKKDLYLIKIEDQYQVFTYSEDQYVRIDRIMVHYNGGTDWLPTVEYVELFSTNVTTGKAVVETIYP